MKLTCQNEFLHFPLSHSSQTERNVTYGVITTWSRVSTQSSSGACVFKQSNNVRSVLELDILHTRHTTQQNTRCRIAKALEFSGKPFQSIYNDCYYMFLRIIWVLELNECVLTRDVFVFDAKFWSSRNFLPTRLRKNIIFGIFRCPFCCCSVYMLFVND